jgi:pyridoxamine-phosphate oxidase
MHRQVRIEGDAEKISFQESEEYFHSRPFGSQIGAITSDQSAKSKGRAFLESRYEQLYEQYEKEGKAPMPEHWGGYLVKPDYYEFWQGRESRLHDRFEYVKVSDNWQINRLDP